MGVLEEGTSVSTSDETNTEYIYLLANPPALHGAGPIAYTFAIVVAGEFLGYGF